MRLKLQTRPPLPELKAWFSPHPDDVPRTVSELKRAICMQVPALKAKHLSGNDLLLVLDDFELIGDSPINVVRDGDLILVKPSYPIQKSAEETTRKRKRAAKSFSPEPSSKRQKDIAVDPLSDSESSDESESSSASSSSSSTSSSSSASSTSSSSSASSSASSSSSSPSPYETPYTPVVTKAILSQQNKPLPIMSPLMILLSQIHVPPGYGKPQTHSRNLRRRIKKKFDKAKLAQSDEVPPSHPPQNISSSNALPLGGRTVSPTLPVNGTAAADAGRDTAIAHAQERATTVNMDGGNIMMSTLRNKNKRKGFKQSMNAPLPGKIVFDEESEARASGVLSPQQALMGELPGPDSIQARPRLIPPSEKQELGELPPRMFVTSVDLEEGLWNKKRKKQKQKECEEGDWGYRAYEDTSLEQDVQLHYSDEVTGNGFDWIRAERDWDRFVSLTSLEQLTVGTLVGWKGLALDPVTFSPALMVSVASIVRLPTPNAENQLIVVIKQFARPGASNPSLSHRIIGRAEDEDEEETKEEEFTWDNILTSQWKILEI
ncbi:hypothetical protein H0H93_001282 [Arthromyces matolae]|nr:hypothetical protein H0H93_001282 [Arthromyces matolae]